MWLKGKTEETRGRNQRRVEKRESSEQEGGEIGSIHMSHANEKGAALPKENQINHNCQNLGTSQEKVQRKNEEDDKSESWGPSGAGTTNVFWSISY